MEADDGKITYICDLRLKKDFRLGEHATVSLIGEGFNMFNETNIRGSNNKHPQENKPRRARFAFGLLPAITFAAVLAACSQTAGQASRHDFFRISLGTTFAGPVSGRMLLFIAPSSADGNDEKPVDIDMMSPASVYVAAKEVAHLAPGDSVDIDADDIAFPQPFSKAPAGSYRLQAVLDVHHSYNYDGRVAGDLLSAPLTLSTPLNATAVPVLTLNQLIPEPPDPLAERPDVNSALKPLDMISSVLTSFWGREIHMRGWVLLPPGYSADPGAHYPTVYFTHGFGGTLRGLRERYAPMLYDRMKQGRMPEMIWVLLDESCPTGTHEFADSVNNGPWGTALTTELIPNVEGRYRMDARTSGRFLQGHSSGGWATLWLQTRYPKIFGGTWSTSPDPSDFHFFSTIDLYAVHANMYRAPDGALHPMIREHGVPRTTMQQLAGLEAVIGPYGGQLASFEWVFSPRGADGRPSPLFDRTTGDIDPAVADYWQTHYDIVQQLKRNWKAIGPDLKGKIHLFVGTDDTFYLDGAAHSLQATLERLGGNGQVTFLPGRSHFNVYNVGDDRYGLFDRIAVEMYRVARPKMGTPDLSPSRGRP
jgi:enterochelin esterase-like enzyme